MGITFAIFQALGTLQYCMKKLIIIARGCTRARERFLYSRGLMLSGPAADLPFSLVMALATE